MATKIPKVASNGPIRQRTAMAMGAKVTVGGGGGNAFKAGNAGQSITGGSSKAMPSSIPFKTAVKTPKGAK